MEDGLTCPEATQLTCTTSGAASSSALRWNNGSSSNLIDALVYNFQESDEFPLTILAENRSSAFVSYVIESADFDPTMAKLGVNFTSVLVVNPELLLSNGYRSLLCGGIAVMDDFTINQLDMEGEEQSTRPSIGRH